MLRFFSKHHFYESVALAALFAVSLTLHIAWISNLLVARVAYFQTLFNIVPSIGPVSGLYLNSFLSFIILFVLVFLYWRGKDCSHARKTLFSFFLFSLVTFFVMTLPFVYQFSVLIE